MRWNRWVLCMVLLGCMRWAGASETVVMVRHGEKPMAGLGQLSCKGLQRSLALPKVLAGKFGHPDVIMAPNPGAIKRDGGQPYNYIRPLATIEPTAIALGMPVSANLAFDDVDGLEKALKQPALAGKVVFVAWEHYFIETVVRNLLTHAGGDPKQVPEWRGSDFDSIYVVTLDTDADGKATATFKLEREHLDDVPATCP